MSMDLARKTFSCEPEYFIAGTNIRIATAVKEAGADLSAHTPVLLAEGKVTPVAEAAKLTGLYGVTAEAAKSGEDAIIYLSKNIALQEGRNGIRVNVVCPGQTATDAVKGNMSEAFQELFLRHTPIRRMGTPEEIAAAVLYFASEEAAYTTGQVLSVSGGFGMGTPVYGDLMGLSAENRH